MIYLFIVVIQLVPLKLILISRGQTCRNSIWVCVREGLCTVHSSHGGIQFIFYSYFLDWLKMCLVVDVPLYFSTCLYFYFSFLYCMGLIDSLKEISTPFLPHTKFENFYYILFYEMKIISPLNLKLLLAF